MKAWLFQDHRQRKKHGAKAPWSVGWIDPRGKRKSKRIGAKSHAEKFRRKLEGELAAGLYRDEVTVTWAAFRAEYAGKVATPELRGAEQRRVTTNALDHFERLCAPRLLSAINTAMLADYIAKRSAERGKKEGDRVSPATINKELRCLKAVLRIAHEWELLAKIPKITMLREPQKIPPNITTEHFGLIYDACDAARFPDNLPFTAGDWWRALLTFCYMTGWRIEETLSLRRDDLDLDQGLATTRHDNNKGKRDEQISLHPVVINHLRRIACFEPVIFPWPRHRRTLWLEFQRIQKAAGIHLACDKAHRHTDSCHLYGFHGCRFAFATNNCENMPAVTLQRMMRHKSFSTTQRYINMIGATKDAAANLYVPPALSRDTA